VIGVFGFLHCPRLKCQKEMMEKTAKLKQDSRDRQYAQSVAAAGKLAADETQKAEEKQT
jgi:hypothetical protein